MVTCALSENKTWDLLDISQKCCCFSYLVWSHCANHLTFILQIGVFHLTNVPNILGEEILPNLKNMETINVKILTGMCTLGARLPPETQFKMP
jgi:hypothetical protein